MSLAFLIVALMLAGASWSDLRTRRVPNQYWWPFVVIAGALWLSSPGDQLLLRAGGAAAMTLLAYLLWRVGTFGGADAKGLMVFAWLWPGVPDVLAARTVPVLDTLVNATLIAVAMPLAFLAVNLLRGDFAFPAALLGTRMPLAQAQQRHVWPMQRLRDDIGEAEVSIAPPASPALPVLPATPGYAPAPIEGTQAGPLTGTEVHGVDGTHAGRIEGIDAGAHGTQAGPTGPDSASPGGSPPPAAGNAVGPRLAWRFWHRPGDSLGATYQGLRAAGVEHVWVTPKIPFMVPLTLASVATWAWGNVVLRMMSPG